jgi:hypothetical protein
MAKARGSRDRQTETANTDPAGEEYRPRGETWYRDGGRQASREPFRALTWRLSMGFRGNPGLDRQDPTISDPLGEDYRSCGEETPTRLGDFYRSRREMLPTSVGCFTHRSGADYRPVGETLRAKYRQICGFLADPMVYMVSCLCLLVCLVNREVLGGRGRQNPGIEYRPLAQESVENTDLSRK